MIYEGIINDIEMLKSKVGLKLIDDLKSMYSEKVNEIWIPIDEAYKTDIATLGIDGSVNRAKVRGSTIFMVRAVGIYTKPKSNDIFARKEKVGVVKYPKLANERTIVYMEGLEAELYNTVLDNMVFNDEDSEIVMLMDGMFSVASECASAFRMYGCEPFHGSLNDLLAFERDFEGSVSDLIRMECGWKKELYKNLARRASKITTIYVAKTYHDNSIFKHPEIYDIEILDLIARGKGMSKPLTKKIKVGCNDKKEVILTTSYMRFSTRGAVYFVEVVGDTPLSEGEMKTIYHILERYSVGGYPLPLKLAHRRAEIPDKLMRTLIRKIGGAYLKSGREAL